MNIFNTKRQSASSRATQTWTIVPSYRITTVSHCSVTWWYNGHHKPAASMLAYLPAGFPSYLPACLYFYFFIFSLCFGLSVSPFFVEYPGNSCLYIAQGNMDKSRDASTKCTTHCKLREHLFLIPRFIFHEKGLNT